MPEIWIGWDDDGPIVVCERPECMVDGFWVGRLPGHPAPEEYVELADAHRATHGGPTPVRPPWDDWGIGIARAVAARADCSRRKVGAVILDWRHRVVATGYNGAPSGQPGCLTAGACPRASSGVEGIVTSYDSGAGACIALHAEQNAIVHASYQAMDGGTMYLTCEPCPGCRRTIAGTPLSRVVWPDGGYTFGLSRQELPL